MKNTGLIIFRITRVITVIGILAAAYAIIEGSFFCGFGDDEFIMALIFYAVFLPSLLYTVGYFIYTKLPDADETGTDPPWFKRLCIGATTYPLIIAAFGVFNAVTGIVEFFGKLLAGFEDEIILYEIEIVSQSLMILKISSLEERMGFVPSKVACKLVTWWYLVILQKR